MESFSRIGDITLTSSSFDQQFFSQETESVFIVLLTLSNDDLDEDIRIASDPYELLPTANVRGVESDGLEYIFMPFEITLPRDDSTGTVSATLTIDNVEREVIAQARSVRTPINVKMQCVLSDDVDVVEIEYDYFQLSNVSYDSMTVSGELTLDYWGLEPFPSGRFIPSQFPGLF